MKMISPLAAKAVPLHVVQLNNVSIFQQLQWEEALLRADQRNWCLINRGSPQAIVMGISGSADQMIDKKALKQKSIPIIKRFSGGGTVLIDPNTIFVTWICNTADVSVACCPTQIHIWAENFYKHAWPFVPLKFKENDYVIGDRKCGGNAQYLCKNRWLHHTSFLWDYDSEKMNTLLMPKKMPSYRNERNHSQFLCRLKEHVSEIGMLENRLIKSLQEMFDMTKKEPQDLIQAGLKEHRRATHLVEM